MFIFDIKDMFFNKKCIKIFLIFCAVTFVLYFRGNIDTAVTDTDSKIRAGITDNESSLYSKLILGFLTESSIFSKYVNITKGTSEEMIELTKSDKLDVSLILPKGFINSMINIENAPITAYINMADTTKAMLLNTMFKSYEKYVMAVQANCIGLYDTMKKDGFTEEEVDKANTEISYKLIDKVVNKNDYFNNIIIEKFKNIPLIIYYSYELLFLFITYIGMSAGIRMIKEQKNGIFPRLKAAGIKSTVYTAKKWFLYAIITSIAVLAIFILRGILENKINKNSFIFSVLFAFLICAFMILFSTIFKNVQSFLFAVNIIVLLQMVVGGGVIPLIYLPKEFIEIARFTPNYWFITRIFALEEQVNAANMNLFYFVLVIIIIFCITAAGAVYKRREVLK